jgi:hypothetical protein
MDVEAEVRVLADVGLTRVQAHANPHVDAVGPVVPRKGTLCRHRGRGRAGSLLEHDEELVAAVIDDMAFPRLDALAQKPAGIAEHPRVLVAEPLQQLRRCFDVGEEESDGAMG